MQSWKTFTVTVTDIYEPVIPEIEGHFKSIFDNGSTFDVEIKVDFTELGKWIADDGHSLQLTKDSVPHDSVVRCQ